MAYYNPSAELPPSFVPQPLPQFVNYQGTNHPNTVPALVQQQRVPEVHRKYVVDYSKITSVCLGILQIGICLLSVAAGIVALEFEAPGAEHGTGFWCGIVYGIFGIITLVAGLNSSNASIIAATSLSIAPIVFGITQMTLAVIDLSDVISFGDICLITHPASAGAYIAMFTFGGWETFFGFCLLIVGCRAICCPSIDAGTVFVQTQQPVVLSSAAPMQIQGVCEAEISASANYQEIEDRKFVDSVNNEQSHPFPNGKS